MGRRAALCGLQISNTRWKSALCANAFGHRQYVDSGFTLNTGRIRDQWHTMTRTGLVPKLFGHRAEPYVEIHPADAQTLNLKDAELASVSGAHGSSVVRVFISNSVSASDIFQPMHWSSEFSSSPKANASTPSAIDPISGQPALKSAQVAITRFPAQWFGFGVMLARDPPSLTIGRRGPCQKASRLSVQD